MRIREGTQCAIAGVYQIRSWPTAAVRTGAFWRRIVTGGRLPLSGGSTRNAAQEGCCDRLPVPTAQGSPARGRSSTYRGVQEAGRAHRLVYAAPRFCSPPASSRDVGLGIGARSARKRSVRGGAGCGSCRCAGRAVGGLGASHLPRVSRRGRADHRRRTCCCESGALGSAKRDSTSSCARRCQRAGHQNAEVVASG